MLTPDNNAQINFWVPRRQNDVVLGEQQQDYSAVIIHLLLTKKTHIGEFNILRGNPLDANTMSFLCCKLSDKILMRALMKRAIFQEFAITQHLA